MLIAPGGAQDAGGGERPRVQHGAREPRTRNARNAAIGSGRTAPPRLRFPRAAALAALAPGGHQAGDGGIRATERWIRRSPPDAASYTGSIFRGLLDMFDSKVLDGTFAFFQA
jgi:hypothetical protein